MASLLAIAVHEAAHFVAAFLADQDDAVFSISIRPTESSYGENEGEFPLGPDAEVEEIRQAVVSLYAGYEADHYLGSDESAGSLDRAQADNLMASALISLLHSDDEAGRRSEEERLREDARSIVEKQWGAITLLAGRLLEVEKIGADEARLILLAGAHQEGAGEELVHHLLAQWQRLGSRR